MIEASQSPTKILPDPVGTTTKTRLTSCTEAPSITSNAVIACLNGFIISSNPSEASPLIASSVPLHIDPREHSPSYTIAQASQRNIDTWAAKIHNSTDIKIKNHSSPTSSSDGVPRVKIPDSIFQIGVDIHNKFFLGVFMGKTLFGHIQSVLAHIWGRGIKLEIHLRPASKSMLVRIPNSTVINKIVEHEIWHIGSSIFYVAQWTSNLAINPPSFTFIPLWAHVRGISFDLYTHEGLGRVGDLIGKPVEVDEFTRRMSNLEVAHLKVKANCTMPLPTAAEIERGNGEIVKLSIDYPWTPPLCPC